MNPPVTLRTHGRIALISINSPPVNALSQAVRAGLLNAVTAALGNEDFKAIVIAYEKQFSKPMPISAKGETEVHRSMGYDHRGRVDVALNPDQQEGVWLRRYLINSKIPYFAFRRQIPGKATAAHIHIGPPSLPLRSAD